MLELDALRNRITNEYDAGEITLEAYYEGLRLIRKVESYLVEDERTPDH